MLLQSFVLSSIFFFCDVKMFLLSSQSEPIMRLQNALNTLEYQYVAKVDLLFPKPSKVYDSADIIQQKPIIQICNSHLALLSYFDNDLWFHKLVIFNGLTEKIAESRKSFLGINLRKKIIHNSLIEYQVHRYHDRFKSVTLYFICYGFAQIQRGLLFCSYYFFKAH